MDILTTTSVQKHDFDPASWLDAFRAVGGAYALTDSSLHLFTSTMGHCDADNAEARAMVRDLSAEQEQAVRGQLTALAAMSDPIEDAWQRIRRARVDYNSAPEDDDEAEARFWSIVDPAETAIMATEGKTLRHAEIKLWAGICHSVTTRAEEEAARNEDLSALLAVEHTLDFDVRCLLSAMRSIKNMGAL